MFSSLSSRLGGEVNALTRLRREIEAQGREVVDLVSGNVTDHGIVYPPDLLAEILARASRRAAVYRPDSIGQLPAREAVARYYEGQGLAVSAPSIVLTPGTSISYWYSFRLLADPGDEILCPRPSYPLFDYIAAMSGVEMISYPMRETCRWGIDLERLELLVSTRTRAVVLISPHNPTGHVAGIAELEALAEIARRYGLAIISDEVFSEFLFTAETLPRPAALRAPLVITLNGFSKMFALPGFKLGWMALSGEASLVAQGLRALELISDTFLPVNEAVQAAVPEVFELGLGFLAESKRRIRHRWGVARDLLERAPGCRFVDPEGGFYVTLAVGDAEEEMLAERILAETGVLVHPGHYYDIDPEHLVFSFVQEPTRIRSALRKMLPVIADASGRNPHPDLESG